MPSIRSSNRVRRGALSPFCGAGAPSDVPLLYLFHHLLCIFAPESERNTTAMERHIDINRYDYDLPEERIAKFPLAERSASKLLVYRHGEISERHFADIGEELPAGQLLVFNNTKVIRARIIMHKPSGARIEVFCLEPCEPADYERAFAVKGSCEWSCIVGNLKKWKEGYVEINFDHEGRAEYLRAWRVGEGGREQRVRFEWSADMTFGELLETLGRIPIPPYLNRESEEIDNTAVGTTSVRTLESLPALAWRIRCGGEPDADRVIGQWELYDIPASFTGREALETLLGWMDARGVDRIKAATRIMITPLDYHFRIVSRMVTNFHQPKSTLLLLVSAFVGDDWRRIYDYALKHNFRFLSYGDSSLLMP